MDDVEIENQHEEEGENRGEDHVEVGPEFKVIIPEICQFLYTTALFWPVYIYIYFPFAHTSHMKR